MGFYWVSGSFGRARSLGAFDMLPYMKDKGGDWSEDINTGKCGISSSSGLTTSIKSINVFWYNTLLSKVGTDELEDIISKLPNKKVSGQLNLQYEWFEHLSDNAVKILRNIINTSLNINDILCKWKLGYIYPIPKTIAWTIRIAWANNLNITKPIILLETG
ncbi:hypothetical protein Glove_350g65 [Diversispora epigaea]|uniref:Uncharacterized protein n=1 Tax=Diversispora epigaea TaxID=1348612 RepID=A0A397HD55_9GLOM|nr:hypothetical protein Glove_350g65 [Diversispora epigaea]